MTEAGFGLSNLTVKDEAIIMIAIPKTWVPFKNSPKIKKLKAAAIGDSSKEIIVVAVFDKMFCAFNCK